MRLAARRLLRARWFTLTAMLTNRPRHGHERRDLQRRRSGAVAMAASLIATALPALATTRVDPNVALRAE